eukprot:sb/3472944/
MGLQTCPILKLTHFRIQICNRYSIIQMQVLELTTKVNNPLEKLFTSLQKRFGIQCIKTNIPRSQHEASTYNECDTIRGSLLLCSNPPSLYIWRTNGSLTWQGALRSFAAKNRAPPVLRIVKLLHFNSNQKMTLKFSKNLVEIYKKLVGHFVIRCKAKE